MSNFFGLSLQYFGKVLACGFVILFLCCFYFVLAVFICMFCIFMTYFKPCCCHYKLTDPWYVCMYVVFLKLLHAVVHRHVQLGCALHQ